LQETARELSAARESLNHVIRRFPYFVMVVRGPELTIESYGARYAVLFGDQDLKGISIDKVFGGHGIDELMRSAREALAKNITINTAPMVAHVPNDAALGSEFIHIIVPIPGAAGQANGLIIFTENVTERRGEQTEIAGGIQS
jgi:hypothetical protein